MSSFIYINFTQLTGTMKVGAVFYYLCLALYDIVQPIEKTGEHRF